MSYLFLLNLVLQAMQITVIKDLPDLYITQSENRFYLVFPNFQPTFDRSPLLEELLPVLLGCDTAFALFSSQLFSVSVFEAESCYVV